MQQNLPVDTAPKAGLKSVTALFQALLPPYFRPAETAVANAHWGEFEFNTRYMDRETRPLPPGLRLRFETNPSGWIFPKRHHAAASDNGRPIFLPVDPCGDPRWPYIKKEFAVRVVFNHRSWHDLENAFYLILQAEELRRHEERERPGTILDGTILQAFGPNGSISAFKVADSTDFLSGFGRRAGVLVLDAERAKDYFELADGIVFGSELSKLPAGWRSYPDREVFAMQAKLQTEVARGLKMIDRYIDHLEVAEVRRHVWKVALAALGSKRQYLAELAKIAVPLSELYEKLQRALDSYSKTDQYCNSWCLREERDILDRLCRSAKQLLSRCPRGSPFDLQAAKRGALGAPVHTPIGWGETQITQIDAMLGLARARASLWRAQCPEGTADPLLERMNTLDRVFEARCRYEDAGKAYRKLFVTNHG